MYRTIPSFIKVHVLHGYKTKSNHITSMKKMYKHNNIDVVTHKFKGLDVLQPVAFSNRAKHITKQIEKQKKPFFLHSLSAGYMTLCEINAHLTTKPLGNIIESAPGLPLCDPIQTVLLKTHNISVPKFIINYWLKKHCIIEWNENR